MNAPDKFSLLFRSGGWGVGVLDDIKAISAFNLVEVEVEAELGKIQIRYVE